MERYILTMTGDVKFKDKTKGKMYYMEDKDKTVRIILIHGSEVSIGTSEEFKI